MTTISQPEYMVFIQTEGEHIGETTPTVNLPEAKDRLLSLQAVYPQSALMVRRGDDWQEIADDNLNALVYAHTAHVLALIVSKNEHLPLVGWRLAAWQPGVLEGSADDREQVEAYADLLKVEMAEQERETHTAVKACGTFLGVKVEVSAYIRAEQAAEVSA